MAFSVKELEHAANSLIEYHFQTPKVKSQTLQERPLLEALTAKQTTFPGGKDAITVRVKGEYTTTIQGFSHDDEVSYANPANVKTATYPWKLVHAGITFSMHELIKGGISISDSTDGTGESRVTEQEKIALVDMMKDKLEDMTEGTERGMNLMFWRDGTQDANLVPGITSFILDNPASATVVGGIDQSSNTWWRNRANVSIDGGTPSNLPVLTVLQKEFRQLRRYGGRPNLLLAGSDMIEQLEKELKAKGEFTNTGFNRNIDLSVGDVSFKGMTVQYDPTLDDLSKSKYLYVLDTRTIFPKVVSGEDMKKHTPARPENKYVFYRAVTWVGGLVCNQRNANGVYAIS